MRAQLFSIYRSLNNITKDLARKNNFVLTDKYFVDDKSKKSEILKTIRVNINFIQAPQYMYLTHDKNNKDKINNNEFKQINNNNKINKNKNY